MRVTLIHPPQFVAFGNHVSTIAMPPIGLAYLGGSLLDAGHQVTMVDGFGEGLGRLEPFGSVFLWGLPNSEIISRIPKDTQLIGLDCMFSSSWLSVRDLLREIKTAYPNIPLILGGEHATGLPEICFDQSPVDLIAQGEGEETLLELVDKIEKGESIAGIPGIGFRSESRILKTTLAAEGSAQSRTLLEGRVTLNPRRDRRRNVDDIPMPAWDLINLENYQSVNQPHGISRGRFMPMLATRGCPFQCTFCTSPRMWTQFWLPRTPKKVVDEIELYVRKYQVADIQFEDLTAIVRKDWILEFCREIIDRNLKITFQLPSGTRSEAVDQEVALLMKRAGCHEFAFAPESGDEETLKIIRKQVDLKKMFSSARGALKAGINVSCFFIVGFPHERWKHILNTYWVLAKCAVMGIKTVSVNVFSPQPSTRLFEELQQRGMVTLDDNYLRSLFEFPAFGRKKRSFNPRFSDSQITAVSVGGMLIFYGIRYLLRPYLLVGIMREMFGKSSGQNENRLGKYLRSVRKEFFRIAKFRLNGVLGLAQERPRSG